MYCTKVIDTKTLIEKNIPPRDSTLPNNSFAFGDLTIDLQIVKSTLNFPTDSNLFLPPENIFLSKAYLSILESSQPAGMTFYYVFYSIDGKPGGFAYFQDYQPDWKNTFFQKRYFEGQFLKQLINTFFHSVAGYIRTGLLICGGIQLTGEHGFFFKPDFLSSNERVDLVEKTMKEIIRNNPTCPSVFFLKDLNLESRKNTLSIFKSKGYAEEKFQPNMILDIPSNWKCFDDYLAALSSKYRVRARRAFKKAQGIYKRELNEQEIEENLDLIYDLYLNIAKNVDFNLFLLPKSYFLNLKKTLGAGFHLVGYFIEEKMVGFYSAIVNHGELEAHFLGFNKATNHTHQIYLNMLFDLVKKGIDLGKEKIVFARTALEIKSSVGAKPVAAVSFLKHRNPILNSVLSPVVGSFQRNSKWEARNPFKAG